MAVLSSRLATHQLRDPLTPTVVGLQSANIFPDHLLFTQGAHQQLPFNLANSGSTVFGGRPLNLANSISPEICIVNKGIGRHGDQGYGAGKGGIIRSAATVRRKYFRCRSK